MTSGHLLRLHCSPPTSLTVTDVDDYREELVFSLSTARWTAANLIKAAQSKYKKHYDVPDTPYQYRIGSWVFVHFPQEETGKQRKLSRPWHGPYRVASVQDPDVSVVKVYFPDDGVITDTKAQPIKLAAAQKLPEYSRATIIVKVLSLRNPTLLDNGKTKQDVIIADSSGIMTVTLWEGKKLVFWKYQNPTS